MKLRPHRITPHVECRPDETYAVHLVLSGLRFAMSSTEARTLADQLHDAAEDIDR